MILLYDFILQYEVKGKRYKKRKSFSRYFEAVANTKLNTVLAVNVLVIMRLVVLLLHVGLAFGQWETNYVTGHAGMVHLFEWHWKTIAEECETFLGPKKFGGVQVRIKYTNKKHIKNI